jgi:hypothetical protein
MQPVQDAGKAFFQYAFKTIYTSTYRSLQPCFFAGPPALTVNDESPPLAPSCDDVTELAALKGGAVSDHVFACRIPLRSSTCA